MRSVLILCLVLAGCGVPPIPTWDGGQEAPDAAPGVDAGDPDLGTELDAGSSQDEGTDAGTECNPGVHTSACMNPASCIGADHVCRPCC